MIKGKDIIVMGLQPWDIEIGSNCKNIAMEFAKNNRVLYINPPLTFHAIRKNRHNDKVIKRLKIIKGEISDIHQIEPKLWVFYPKIIISSINWIRCDWLFDVLNQQNNKRFAKEINRAKTSLGFKDVILFNDNHIFLGLYMKNYIKPQFYIYYLRDNLINFPYWKKHGLKLEPELIREADLVVTNSSLYAEYASKYNTNSYMVGQGCDISLFNDEIKEIEIPVEMNNIAHPIIGYIGNLTALRLDIKLLEFIAQQKPHWNIVLIGPEDETFKTSNLHQMANVYFLGAKPENELPHYLKSFDVAINPQLINEITNGNYPRKIDEYLAMGKPIVASATKAMDYFKDYTYLAHSYEDYFRLIDKALKEDNEELRRKRKDIARSHTWENSVNLIYQYVENTLS